MSRPKPTILIERTDKHTYRTEQVIKASGLWAVQFDGKFINLKSGNKLVNYPGPKYKRTVFGNPGHAYNLAERLNKEFKTDKFTVKIIE